MKRTPPARYVFAAVGASPAVLAWLAGGSLVPACGGAQRAPEVSDAAPPDAFAGADPGSGPFDCSVANQYDMSIIEDFEFGAATGWYTNNEVCYPWTQAMTECVDAGIVC